MKFTSWVSLASALWKAARRGLLPSDAELNDRLTEAVAWAFEAAFGVPLGQEPSEAVATRLAEWLHKLFAAPAAAIADHMPHAPRRSHRATKRKSKSKAEPQSEAEVEAEAESKS